jgi:hypothetical protein
MQVYHAHSREINGGTSVCAANVNNLSLGGTKNAEN